MCDVDVDEHFSERILFIRLKFPDGRSQGSQSSFHLCLLRSLSHDTRKNKAYVPMNVCSWTNCSCTSRRTMVHIVPFPVNGIYQVEKNGLEQDKIMREAINNQVCNAIKRSDIQGS